jgi:predicted 3-demethylubiquinone-9 3-methyltransferase (glyoxalase superfamily)
LSSTQTKQASVATIISNLFQLRTDMPNPAKNTIYRWYNDNAEDSARIYAQPSPDSIVGAVHRAPGNYPAGEKGDVLTAQFTVMGVACLGRDDADEKDRHRHYRSGGARLIT